MDVVGEAEHGAEALARVAAAAVDVVSMDLRMPGMGELAARDRARRSRRGTSAVCWWPTSPNPGLPSAVADLAALLGYRRGMSLPLEDVPFTEFIQRPTAATGRLATVRALRLRRRDADDLVVMSAARAEREREVIELTARLLSSLVHHANGPALLQELLPEILPWTRFLPAIDRQNLIQEFTEVTGAAASVDNVAPIAQLLIEWRHTAEVHADPELHALLSAPRGEDHGPVLPPDPQDGE